MEPIYTVPEIRQASGDGACYRRGTVPGSAGFTLAEVMVVVAIIGLVATMAIPAYLKMLPHLRLKSAARDMASAMQLARSTAISKNMKTRVYIDKVNNTFVIQLYNSGTWVNATNVPVHSNEWTDIDIYTESGGRLSAAVVSYNLTGDAVEFNSDGTTNIPSTHSSESVFIVSKSNASSSTAERYRVRVIANTGMIYIEKWNQSSTTWG